jgi:hypothetical protein
MADRQPSLLCGSGRRCSVKFQPSDRSVARPNGASQNGWPASPSGSAIDIITTTVGLQRGNKTFQATRSIAPALKAMVEWWDQEIEPVTTLGSYNYRAVRGHNSVISNHGSGTAVDINAARHPLGAAGTVSAVQHARITAKAASLGLKWGGNYRNRKDEMHFEALTPSQFSLARGAADLTRGAVAAGTPVVVLWLGSAGFAAATLGAFFLVRRAKAKRRAGEV